MRIGTMNWIKPLVNGHPKAFQSFTFSPGEKAGMRVSVKSNSINTYEFP
jgi:hypothetical protein